MIESEVFKEVAARRAFFYGILFFTCMGLSVWWLICEGIDFQSSIDYLGSIVTILIPLFAAVEVVVVKVYSEIVKRKEKEAEERAYREVLEFVQTALELESEDLKEFVEQSELSEKAKDILRESIKRSWNESK